MPRGGAAGHLRGVDFGLVDGAGIIHLTFADLLHKVPERERQHWLAHLVAPRSFGLRPG